MKRLIIAILFLIAPWASFAMDKNDLFRDYENDSIFGHALKFDAHNQDADEDLRIENPPKRMHLMPDDNLDEDVTPLLQAPTIINPNTNNDRITNAVNDPSHNPHFGLALNTHINPQLPQTILNEHVFHIPQQLNYGNINDNDDDDDNISQPATKRFICEYNGCGKTFASVEGLYYHLNAVHTQARQYSCHFCAVVNKDKVTKVYSNLSNLLVHLRGHTKPYQCNIDKCSRKFDRESRLISHQETDHHSFTNTVRLGRNYSLKTSPCYMCGVTNITDLSDHKKQCKALLENALVNMSIEPNNENLSKLGFFKSSTQFKCPDCDKIFETRKSLSMHIANLHNKILPTNNHRATAPHNLTSFCCTIGNCCEAFRNELELKTHRLEVHNIHDNKPLTSNQNEDCDN